MSNNINSNDNSVRNRSNVSQDRNLQLERGKIRLQEAFQKIKRARCKKLSKMGLFWKDRVLEVNDQVVQYFSSNSQLKGQVNLSDIFEISFPESEMSKKIAKKCICFTFNSNVCRSYKNGEELPRREISKNGKVGLIMWAFRFGERDINFDLPKDLLALPPPGIQVTRLNQLSVPQRTPQIRNNGNQFQRNLQDRPLNLEDDKTNGILKNSRFRQDLHDDSLNSDNQEQNLFSDCMQTEINSLSFFQRSEKEKRGDNWNWDTMYMRIWDTYYAKAKSSKQLTKKEEIDLAMHLFTLNGQFREVACNSVRELVSELAFPERKRKYYEVDKEHPMYQFKIKGEKVYHVNGMFIRMGHIITTFDANNNPIYNDVATKNLSNEFKSNKLLTNVIHNIILDRKNFKMRIPLTCIVDYLGFKCICYGAPKAQMVDQKKQASVKGFSKIQRSPLDSNKFSLIQGLNYEEKYTNLASVDDDMKVLGQRLKLKPLVVEEDKKTFEIYLSYFCEVHRFFPDDEKQTDKSRDQDKKLYIFRTSTVMPLLIDHESHKQVNIFKDHLRPEFIDRIDKPLSNGAFITSLNTKNELEDTEVAEASQKLFKKVLKQMIDDLDNLKLMAISTEQIRHIFHSYGVNLRLLGKVAETSQLPHVKDICISEMIARSTKKILRANIAIYIFQKFRVGEGLDEDELSTLEEFHGIAKTNADGSSQDRKPSALNGGKTSLSFKESPKRLKQSLDEAQAAQLRMLNSTLPGDKYPQWVTNEEFHLAKDNPGDNYGRLIEQPEKKEMVGKLFGQKIQGIIKDFLNLVFSNDSDTLLFWKTVLKPLIKKDFGYDLPDRFPPSIAQGFLLHSIKYHWRINFHIKEEFTLFTPQPFGTNPMEIKICVNSNIYNFKTIAYQRIVDKYKECIEKQNYELALNYLQIKQKVLEASMDCENTPPQAHELSQLFAEQAQIQLKLHVKTQKEYNDHNETNCLKRAEEMIRQSKKFIPRFHAEVVKLVGVQQILQQLKKSHSSSFESQSKNNLSFSLKAPTNEEAMTEKILQYHLGIRHPLQSFALCFQANQILKGVMRKSRLAQSDQIQQRPSVSEKKNSDKSLEKSQRETIAHLKMSAQKFQEALGISLNILGGFHIKVAEFYQDMAVVYVEMKELRVALDYLQQAKTIIEFADVTNQVALANVIQQIALVYLNLYDNQKALQLAVSSCEKFSKSEGDHFRECVYSNYIAVLALLNYENPNVDTINSIQYYTEELWSYVKQFNTFETKFSQSQVCFIYEFCFKTIIDIELKFLELEFKSIFFEMVLERNSTYQQEHTDKPSYKSSKYQKFFSDLRNRKFDKDLERDQYIEEQSKKMGIKIGKLMKREFYPGIQEMDPSLMFLPSDVPEEEKITVLKKIAFGSEEEAQNAAAQGVQHSQMRFHPNSQENAHQSMTLNVVIKSIFEDMIKKLSHIQRMSSSNAYDSYTYDLTQKFFESQEKISANE